MSTKGTPCSRHTARDQAGPGDQRPGVELLVAQLDDVDAARDAGRHELGQVGTVGRAEIEAAAREVPGGHAPACAWAFIAFLVARTFSRLSASVMSATDR